MRQSCLSNLTQLARNLPIGKLKSNRLHGVLNFKNENHFVQRHGSIIQTFSTNTVRGVPGTGENVLNSNNKLNIGAIKRVSAAKEALKLPGIPKKYRQTKPKVSTNLERYEFKEIIGGGRFGVVKLGTDKVTKDDVAIKVLRKDRHLEVIRAELTAHRTLQLKLGSYRGLTIAKDIYEDSKHVYIVMEFIPGGDMFDYIIEKGPLPENEAKVLLKNLIPIIQQLHDIGVIHRDFKPENVLFRKSECQPGELLMKYPVVSDFGLCRIEGEEDPVNPPAGTFGYAAPEILLMENHCDESCDIWSLGVLMYASIAGKLPFPASMDGKTTVKSHLEAVISGPKFDEPQWSSISSSGRELVEQMLHYDNYNRPSLAVIKHHPWLEL